MSQDLQKKHKKEWISKSFEFRIVLLDSYFTLLQRSELDTGTGCEKKNKLRTIKARCRRRGHGPGTGTFDPCLPSKKDSEKERRSCQGAGPVSTGSPLSKACVYMCTYCIHTHAQTHAHLCVRTDDILKSQRCTRFRPSYSKANMLCFHVATSEYCYVPADKVNLQGNMI